jgi:hypothetical protein
VVGFEEVILLGKGKSNTENRQSILRRPNYSRKRRSVYKSVCPSGKSIGSVLAEMKPGILTWDMNFVCGKQFNPFSIAGMSDAISPVRITVVDSLRGFRSRVPDSASHSPRTHRPASGSLKDAS